MLLLGSAYQPLMAQEPNPTPAVEAPEEEPQEVPAEEVVPTEEGMEKEPQEAEGWGEDDWGDADDEEFEALLEVEITSVAKKAVKISQSPAAIFAITNDEIARTGSRSLAEALRLSPGVTVNQLGTGRWAVSTRGFVGEFGNRLLVLMDGRSVYTPLFSGVYWDVQDMLMEDLARIEVIRGPGATLWGANAVNGIINVISKTAEETQGWYLSTRFSNLDNAPWLQGRYGGQVDEETFYRVYFKWFDQNGSPYANGDSQFGDYTAFRGGFRVDSQISADDKITVQGDVYTGKAEDEGVGLFANPPFVVPYQDVADFDGGNLLARWSHNISETQDFTLQVYYDRTSRDSILVSELRQTVDLDFQHRIETSADNEIMWGFGYRVSFDDTKPRSTDWVPASKGQQTFSAFIQDTWKIIPDELTLTVGSKFEMNDFTGFEVQPSARALWNPADGHTLWGSVSRAVRTPSRTNHHIRLPFGITPGAPPAPTILQILTGDTDFKSEVLIAYELGYRISPLKNLSFDLATFYHDYARLSTTAAGTPVPSGIPGVMTLPITYENGQKGEVYGAELAATWLPRKDLRLVGTYTYTDIELHSGGSGETAEGSTPKHVASLRSYYDVREDLQLNGMLYYTDNKPTEGVGSLVRVDLQVAYSPTDYAQVRAGVQNLFDDKHPEHGQDLFANTAEVERLLYIQLDFRF